MSLLLQSCWLALRPKQYLKNLLLFVAPFTAGVNVFSEVLLCFLGFVIFSFASSLGYVMNDLVDVELDRLHPQKRLRPFASGALDSRVGVTLIVVLFFVVFFSLWITPLYFGLIVAIYIFNTFIYTFYFKFVPVIELFSVAAGFMLRLIAGAVIIDLYISEWFMIVGGFGALFIVSLKRLSEFGRKDYNEVRSTVHLYTSHFLFLIISVSMALSICGYTFWAFSNSNHEVLYQLSIIPFVIGFFQFLWVAEKSDAEIPEEIFFKNRPLILLGISFLILLGTAIY